MSAIPLVMTQDADGTEKFSVPDEAVAALRKFEGKIAVVAVVGLYRTGKSYLVNRMIGNQHGFTVGPTVNACTKGIWMWSEPVPFENARGEKLQLLVLDTEGIGDTKSSSDYDTRIFSLAVLLCSTLIYNSLGSIDESAISNLSFVANLSQHVQVKAKQSSEGETDTGTEIESESNALSSFFPSFMWVIRDFALELVDEDYNDITEVDYLNNCLKQQDGFSSDVLEKNRIRKSLTNFFTHRDCATIVRPLDDETKLQQIDNEPYESLRPEFRQQLEKMRTRVLNQLTPKTLQGKPMSGSMFSTLTKTYVEAMNADGVPTITTAWDHVAKTETKAAMARAVESYETQLSTFTENGSTLPLHSDVLLEQHKKMKSNIKNTFLSSAVGDAIETYLPKLKLKMNEFYTDIVNENEHKSLDFCNALFVQLHADTIQKYLPNASNLSKAENVEETNVSMVDILQDNNAVRNKFEQLKDAYFQQGRGPRVDSVWQEKSTEATFTAYSAIATYEQEKKDDQIRLVEQRARKAESKLSSVAASEEVLRQELEESRKEGGSNEAQTSMLQIKLSGQEQEVEMKKKQLEDVTLKLKQFQKKEDDLKLKHQQEMDQIKLELKEEREKEIVSIPAGQGGCGCVLQ